MQVDSFEGRKSVRREGRPDLLCYPIDKGHMRQQKSQSERSRFLYKNVLLFLSKLDRPLPFVLVAELFQKSSFAVMCEKQLSGDS